MECKYIIENEGKVKKLSDTRETEMIFILKRQIVQKYIEIWKGNNNKRWIWRNIQSPRKIQQHTSVL